MKDLVLYPQTIDELMKLANIIAKSGFGGKQGGMTPEQIATIILAGRPLGLPPIQSLQNLSLSGGRIVPSSGLILAMYLSHGNTFSIEKLTDEECAITFISADGKRNISIRLTMAEVREKKLDSYFDEKIKQWQRKSTWTMFPQQMLFAAVVRKGARIIAPQTTMGLYEADEIESIVPDEAIEPLEAEGSAATATPIPEFRTATETEYIEEPPPSQESLAEVVREELRKEAKRLADTSEITDKQWGLLIGKWREGTGANDQEIAAALQWVWGGMMTEKGQARAMLSRWLEKEKRDGDYPLTEKAKQEMGAILNAVRIASGQIPLPEIK